MKLAFRHKWPVIISLYDVRMCVHCGHLVAGKQGQRLAEQWHAEPEEDTDPGGYIVGDERIEATIDYYADDKK